MGEMPTGVESHAHHALGVQLVTQLVPAHGIEVVHVTHSSLVEERLLHSVGKNGPVGHQVGVDPRMRLDVGVLGAEERFGVVGSQRLDPVDHLTSGIETMPGDALGVLVGQPVTHGEQHPR